MKMFLHFFCYLFGSSQNLIFCREKKLKIENGDGTSLLVIENLTNQRRNVCLLRVFN